MDNENQPNVLKDIADQAARKLDKSGSFAVIIFIVSLVSLSTLYETTPSPINIVWMISIIILIFFSIWVAMGVYRKDK
ncbi:hypothetical protein FOZ71_07385 [Weissella cibaria]|nr:hypothetical protein FOZ71_07385 [Weissella cibaria]